MSLNTQWLDVGSKPPCRPIRLRPKPEIMFGRDDEIRQLVDAIMDHSPVRLSILGPGGIGKTSLALSVFRDEKVISRFGDSRLFISCEAAASIEHIIADLAFYLHVTSVNPTAQLLDVVLYRLRSSSLSLVWDNF